MKYHTKNELGNLDFSEAYVREVMAKPGSFCLVADNVRIKPENSKNRDIRLMRANGMEIHVDGAVSSVIREGYKVYDAEGKLKESYADEAVAEEEYPEVFRQLPEGELCEVKKEDGQYVFAVACEAAAYDLYVGGTEDWEDWDRFLNV